LERIDCPLGATYTVRPGDTFQSIARALGITQRELIARNPLVEPARIQPGQVLCVPAAQPSPAPQPNSPSMPPQPPGPTPSQPSQPSGPTPSQPSQPPRPTPAQTTQPSRPTPSQPSQPPRPTPSQPSQPSRPTPSQPSQPSRPTPSQPSQPSRPTPSQPSQPSRPTPSQPSQPSRPTPSQPSQPPRPIPPQPPRPPQLCPPGYRLAMVQPGERIEDLLIRFDVSYRALRMANPSLPDAPQPGTRFCVPPAGSRGCRTYQLAAGDTLDRAAARLRMTPGALLRLNPTMAPRDFTQGRIICID